MSLNPRRERFCQEFIKDGNATQAAVRAGFSANGAKVTGSRLLTDANVAERIANLQAPVVEAAQLTLASHLAELERLRDAAKDANAFAPAVSAEVARGKASGFYTERKEVRFPDGCGVLMVPAPPNRDDWTAQVAARQAALANRPALATKTSEE